MTGIMRSGDMETPPPTLIWTEWQTIETENITFPQFCWQPLKMRKKGIVLMNTWWAGHFPFRSEYFGTTSPKCPFYPLISWAIAILIINKQVCIPVGRVPPACWPYGGGVFPTLGRGQTPLPLWTEWHTGVKTLHWPKLRLRVVIKHNLVISLYALLYI